MGHFFLVFASVFMAELGDKTQLATLLFASGEKVNKWVVFAASASASVACSALGVLAGSLLGKYIQPKWLSIISGAGFIVIGALVLIAAFRQPQA